MIQKNWQELIKPKKLEVIAWRRSAPRRHRRRRAARARLRPDARQFAAPRAAVVAAGRGDHLDPYRRRAARVLVDPRRARGRRRHRPQRQGHRHQDAGRRRQAPRPQAQRPGRGHRGRHPDDRRHPDPQPEPRHLHARRGRGDPHRVHGDDRQGLCPGRAQSRRGRADRPDADRQPVLAGAARSPTASRTPARARISTRTS